MKHFLLKFLIITLLFSLTGCRQQVWDYEQVSQDERIVIKFSHVVSEFSPKGRAAERWANLVYQRSGGRVEIQVYPNSQLYRDGEEFDALLSNSVQIIAPATANLTQLFPEWQIFDLPFLFDNYQQVHAVLDGPVGKKLAQPLEKNNLTVLATWDNGFKQMSANRPLRLPGDFSGLTFRVMPSKVIDYQFKLLGAKTLPLPFSEVYSALELGKAAGCENPLSNFYTKQFYEVQPYLTVSNHGYLGYVVLTGTGFWNSLPPNVKQLLKETLAEVTAWERETAILENTAYLNKIKEAGKTHVYLLNNKEKEKWQAAVSPVYKKYTPVIGENLIREALAAIGKSSP